MKLSEKHKLFLVLLLKDSLRFQEPIFIFTHEDRLKAINEILNYQDDEDVEMDPAYSLFNPR